MNKTSSIIKTLLLLLVISHAQSTIASNKLETGQYKLWLIYNNDPQAMLELKTRIRHLNKLLRHVEANASRLTQLLLTTTSHNIKTIIND